MSLLRVGLPWVAHRANDREDSFGKVRRRGHSRGAFLSTRQMQIKVDPSTEKALLLGRMIGGPKLIECACRVDAQRKSERPRVNAATAVRVRGGKDGRVIPRIPDDGVRPASGHVASQPDTRLVRRVQS